MEPITFALGSGTLGILILVARIVYNYGRDRKELNGTVERTKIIEVSLNTHIEKTSLDSSAIRQDIARLETKVDLLVDHKIKDK